jgi:hypothetical protein
MSYCEMIGGFAPSGRFPWAWPTLSRTCCTASASGTLSLNWTKTKEVSSRELEKSRSTPLIPATASSMGRVTSSSMSWGLAPG